jgi:two-component system response regulator GlrR
MKSVLVVDDEPAVGATVSRLVRAAGYEPSYVNNALAALSRLESDADSFAAVVSDVHMDRMDGMALAKQISEKWPTLPVILCSGDSGPSPAALGRVPGVAAIVSKPIRLKQLADLLSSIGRR